MKYVTWRLVLSLALLAASAAAAQDKGGGKDPKRDEASSILKIIDPELLARMVDLTKSDKSCDVDAQLFCTIEMKTLNYAGKDYCVAVAPEVKVKTDADAVTKRRIRWKLSVDQLLGKALAFHDDAGIIVTVNQYDQVDRWGKLGDGSGSFNKRRFITWTMRNKLAASATYLPVILWGPSGDEELCAAIDPKIVNVQ